MIARAAPRSARICAATPGLEEIGAGRNAVGGRFGGDLLGRIDALNPHSGVAEKAEERAVIAAELDDEIARARSRRARDDRLAQGAKMVGQT